MIFVIKMHSNKQLNKLNNKTPLQFWIFHNSKRNSKWYTDSTLPPLLMPAWQGGPLWPWDRLLILQSLFLPETEMSKQSVVSECSIFGLFKMHKQKNMMSSYPLKDNDVFLLQFFSTDWVNHVFTNQFLNTLQCHHSSSENKEGAKVCVCVSV